MDSTGFAGGAAVDSIVLRSPEWARSVRQGNNTQSYVVRRT
jgi:hypothetical protein